MFAKSYSAYGNYKRPSNWFGHRCLPADIWHKLCQSALLLGAFGFALIRPALAEIISCSDLLYLVEQSELRFSSIRTEKASEYGGFRTSLVIAGADYCVIIEDAEKQTYRCTWSYPHRDEQARADFEQLSVEIPACLGSGVEVRKDQAVNHPDAYEAYLLTLQGTEARVTLKDKSALDSTFVSILVEGV